MCKGGSKLVHTITHPEEIVSDVISHTKDLQNTVNAVTTVALHHATTSTQPVVHPYAHIDSITVTKIPTITGQPGKIVSHQSFPSLQPPLAIKSLRSSTKAELTFVEKLEASVQDTTVLASSAAGGASGLLLGGDNKVIAGLIGFSTPILFHALLAK